MSASPALHFSVLDLLIGGQTGLAGPVGPRGAPAGAVAVGPTGPQGATGIVGVTGPNGATGAVGAVGPAGPTPNQISQILYWAADQLQTTSAGGPTISWVAPGAIPHQIAATPTQVVAQFVMPAPGVISDLLVYYLGTIPPSNRIATFTVQVGSAITHLCASIASGQASGANLTASGVRVAKGSIVDLKSVLNVNQTSVVELRAMAKYIPD